MIVLAVLYVLALVDVIGSTQLAFPACKHIARINGKKQ
jgi:hypothetical protein